jgi:hypothetical protein
MEPNEEVSEGEVQGIRLTRVHIERSGDRLEGCTIAEVEAGKERSIVAQERDNRDTRGG